MLYGHRQTHKQTETQRHGHRRTSEAGSKQVPARHVLYGHRQTEILRQRQRDRRTERKRDRETQRQGQRQRYISTYQ